MSTRDEILASLQRAFDKVNGEQVRRLVYDDRLSADLGLDSLDFVDLIMALGEELPPEAVDAVIDQGGDLRTVGDVVDRFVGLGAIVAGRSG